MKTPILSLLLLAAGIAVMSSCSREPKACFKVEIQTKDGKWAPTNTGKVGEHFYFSTMCSQNAHALATTFDYGDGTTGHEESHDYTKPGTYTVKCTVYESKKGEKGEKSDVATQTVVVKDLQAEAR